MRSARWLSNNCLYLTQFSFTKETFMSYFGKFSDADKRRRIKTREVVQESQAVRRVPYVVSDFVTTNLIRLVTSRFTARKLLTEFTHNIYFTTAYILAVVGVFNYLRFYHRDQFRSYGLNGHSPGVAEQMQPHNVATFNFVTLPTVLEKSKLLLPSEATLPNQLAQFAITPFVDRVDVYPESLVVQFNEAWADVMARNFYITYPLATEHLRSPDPLFDPNYTNLMVGATPTSFRPVPRIGFAATRSTTDLKTPVDSQTRAMDPWSSVRGLVEVLDEFPLQIEQSIFPVTSGDMPQLYAPPTLNIIDRWADLPIPAGPPLWIRLLGRDVRDAFGFQDPSLPAYRMLIGANENRQRSALLDEFFNPEVLRTDAKHRRITRLKTHSHKPTKRVKRASLLVRMLGRARRRGPAVSVFRRHHAAPYPQMFVKAKQLQLLDAGAPQLNLPERPVAPLGYEEERITPSVSTWEQVQANLRFVRFVGKSVQTFLVDVGRSFFPSKRRAPRVLATTPEVKALGSEETALEEIKRKETETKRYEEHMKVLATRPKSLQAYVQAVRMYRSKLRAYNAKVKAQKQKLRSKTRRYTAALQQYQDTQAFWTQTLPQMIRSAVGHPVPASNEFIVDSTPRTASAWARALMMLDRYELLGTSDIAPRGVPFTDANIARFIEYSLWESAAVSTENSPTFHYYQASPQTQRRVSFLPYTDLGLPYPKRLVQDLIDAERAGGYAAFYDVLAQHNLSDGPAQSQPEVFNFKASPTDQHFQPLITWMRAVSSGAIPSSAPFTKPSGNEYHWALSMKRLVSSEEGVAQLIQALKMSGQRGTTHMSAVQALVEKLHTEVDDYLGQVQALQLESSQASDDRRGLQYATLLADLNSFIACYRDVEHHLHHSIVFGHIRPDARAVSEFISTGYPHMHGFAFPDHTVDQIKTQWSHAMSRYNLMSTTAWHNFKTMFQRRPLEVFVPAGYRPFMEDVFSTIRVPPERTVDIVPRYVLERQLAYYPSYQALQKLYGDLDVSFLPEKPVPKALMANYMPDYYQDYDEDDVNPVKLRKDYYFNILRALDRAPLTGDAVIELKDRDAVLNFLDVALSESNWLKDRPANFRGQAARLANDRTNRGEDQHKIMLARMGARPSFMADSDLLTIDRFSAAQQHHEFPLKLQGYRREFFYCNSLETLTPEAKDSLLEKYAKRKANLAFNPLVRTQKPWGWFRWFNMSREKSQLDTQEGFLYSTRQLHKQGQGDELSSMLDTQTDLYLPRLTMDEWHALFQTALQTAQETNDPDFLLDLPVLLYQGTGISQLGGFQSRMFDTRTRSAALTQLLMAITEHNYGAYDLLGYENILNLLHYQDQHYAHTSHQPRLVPHFEIPKDEVQPEPTGAPTWIESSSWRNPSHGRGRWARAEKYILETAGYKKKDRDWSKVTKPILNVLQKLPGGKKLTRQQHVFQDNIEPITAYWWLYGGKLVFYMWLYRMFWFMWGTSWEELKMVLLENFGGRRLRALFVDLGIENPFTYRVIIENPNTFRKSAGALNPTLFVQACESVLHLRNKCRPGTTMPKGLLLTGIPGTGKTFMVQMIAGESKVPVITQTAGELFNKRNSADLDIDQLFTPAEQLGFAFERARDLAPCILFIDEIDALGQSRENVLMSTLDKKPNPDTDLYGYVRVKHTPPHKPLNPRPSLKERSILDIFTKRTVEKVRAVQRKWLTYEPYPGAEPIRTEEIFVYKEERERQEMQQVGALTEFLVQMDGLRPLEGVLVIGATNRIHVLDSAITRPGRLEQIVELFPPGARERLEIFQKECAKVGVVSGISWNYLVNRTRGLTVANLTTAINHSAIRAITLHSPHTVETLEYGLDTMRRHKLGLKMISTRPMPEPSKTRSRDPYLFLRVAYYNAGKVLLQNILPDHPSLAYAKLEVEPFQPEYSIRDLFLHNYNRTDLEIRLIGLHAGKAAEYLMLYGTKPEGVLPSAIHLLESDQGADELAFASELANAMVDEWFLYEDKRLPLRINPRDNDNSRNFHRAKDIEPRESLEYWLNTGAKAFARLSSERDLPPFDTRTKSYPPGHTIYQRYEELAYWATRISRIELSALTQDYIKWFNYYLPEPFKSERSRFWIPPDYYYHQDPATFINYDDFMKFINESDVDWNSVGKGWEEQIREWDPTGNMLPESKRPMVTFPDWHLVDRDYIMQSLMGVSFETALNVLQEFRPLLDALATHILDKKIIRQDTIRQYIREYTETRVQAGATTPIHLAAFSNTEALAGLRSNIPPTADAAAVPSLIAPIDYMRPPEEFTLTEDNQFLEYEKAWGPASRKPVGKKIPLSYFNNPDILKRAMHMQYDFADAFLKDESAKPVIAFEDDWYGSDEEDTGLEELERPAESPASEASTESTGDVSTEENQAGELSPAEDMDTPNP